MTRPFRLPPLPPATVVVLAALALALWSQWLPAALQPYAASEWLRDQLVRAQASDVVEDRLVVVDINEASLAAAGPWPWPRERLAALLEQLLGFYGARGVALDIVLPEPADAGGDRRLAMLAQHGPLVMPQAFDYNGALALRVGALAGGAAAARPDGALAASGYIANHAGLGQAVHVGNIGFIPDPDGMIRRLPMQTRFEGRRYPTLSLALLDCCGGGRATAAAAPAAAPAQCRCFLPR